MKAALNFGAMGDPLADQLEAQGLTADAGKLAHLQRATEARQYLTIHGFLSDAESARAVKRIAKAVFAVVTVRAAGGE